MNNCIWNLTNRLWQEPVYNIDLIGSKFPDNLGLLGNLITVIAPVGVEHVISSHIAK